MAEPDEEDVVAADEAKDKGSDELFDELRSSRDGLTTEEAEKRLARDGPNEITEKKQNPVLKFLRYFWGPIPWMIEAAAIMSAAIFRWEDFGIITVLLLINAGVGFWQERKADTVIELLKKRLVAEVRVLRDGEWKQDASRILVPGDVVRVRLGDIVPADLKLFDGDYLSVVLHSRLRPDSITDMGMPETSVRNIPGKSSIRLG